MTELCVSGGCISREACLRDACKVAHLWGCYLNCRCACNLRQRGSRSILGEVFLGMRV